MQQFENDFKSQLTVAPMEGLTTFPMRLWLHLVSRPSAMTTPFLRVTRAHPERDIPADFVPELYQLRDVLPYSITPQFISGDPEQFLRVTDMMPPFLAPVLELNCGCPSPNSLGRLAGSGMLHDPEFFGRTLENLSKALGPGRLAIKMRLGIDDPDEFPALLRAILDLPLARLTVHGRTRSDGYRGQARWEAIEYAAGLSKTPVIASGDVLGYQSLKLLRESAPHITGAMIGRGVLRNPWVFTEIREAAPVPMDFSLFANAIFCYVLLQELWQNHPQKLLARVSSGRIGAFCGTDFAAWERLTVELTSLVCGLPFLMRPGFEIPPHTVSNVAFSRLKILWAYLRSGLPKEFALPQLMRAPSLTVFFQRLLELGESEETIHLTHHAEWDTLFAGARG